MFKRLKKISLLGLFLAGVSLASTPAVQAQINTGVEFGSATGLAGGDIRTTIARIIQAFLGILGIVALVLIIYAGFLWMTSGGDEERVTRAKRIMTQAVIGLIIILSSFAITTFIVSRLTEATGAVGGDGGGGDGGGGGGGGLGSGAFMVDSITPPGSQPADFLWPKNSLVRVVLKNGVPDPATVPGSISVSAGGVAISGTIQASGNSLIFAATAKCAENPAFTCLPGNSSFTVAISPTLKSIAGKDLFCGKCAAAFSTSDIVDTQNPTVRIASPADGESVSANAFVPVIANAADDSAVAEVEFFANDVSLGSSGSSPWQMDWDTTGIPIGTTVTLKAKATDAVGNTALANPVTVTVRPAHCFNNAVDGGETGLNCGDGCGACAGGACAVNSDCSSGLCENGRCVNRPRIDAVAPGAGGPGTLVTITGASFGAAPGEVLFMGSAASGDEKSAPACAPAAWTDTQVIVTLPEGAVSGPIQITNQENLSDRTDDAFGNVSIPDFTVNTQVKPGICTVSPNSGASGAPVDVIGNGFGDSQAAGGISVAGRPAPVTTWSGTKITMAVPNLLGGTWPVIVTAAGNDSNSVAFNVPVSANTAPHIASVDPSFGPVGEYITLTGTNFGNTPGTVSFISGADTVIGDVNFPAACGNNYWSDTSATVKVPSGLPDGNVKLKVTRSGPVDSDNTINFAITPGTPKPGICRIDPVSGPIGIPYTMSGERLGIGRGKVFFRDNVEGTGFVSLWNDSQIGGAVPARSVTGRVYAVSASADTSNSLNFTVADCRNASVCTGSAECCTDGACRSQNADGSSGCTAPRLAGSYRYRFSTGDIPLTPQVVEEITCAERSQSPSPYKDVVNACVNSVMGVRFTLPMDAATLNAGNASLEDCGNGAAFDAANCGAAVAGTVTVSGGGQMLDDGLVLTPADNLKPGEWYRGRISKNVHSSGGVPMNNDYVWTFRVRDSAAPCTIESISVAPAVNKLVDIYSDATREGNENKTFTTYQANPADATCNELKCADYSWSWASDSNSAQVVNPGICRPEVRALAETPVAVPARISATAMGKTGTGELTVKFADPQVIDKWPACQTACLEAEVAASFNTAVSNISSGTVKLFKCNNESCASMTEVSGYNVSVDPENEQLAVIHPPVAADGTSLEANVFYRVVVIGGNAGIHSSAGANLVGTNYAYGAAQVPAYSWVFRTNDSHCQVDSVATSPATIVTSIVGSYHPITAVPRSAPDSCSATGERINTDGLNFVWTFSPSTPGAANLYGNGAMNVKPLASSYATSACLNAGSTARPICGNGLVENGSGRRKTAGDEAVGGGEECDLAARNGQTGSGCSASCLLTGETDRTCGNGVADPYTLGDGSTIVMEQCDKGANNGKPGAGCSSTCLRLGSSSSDSPTVCGNGDVSDSEQCDFGSGKNGSGTGCSSECLDEGSVMGAGPICGNNLVEQGEDCEPGLSRNCSASCQWTGTPSCAGSNGIKCCGNGLSDGSSADPGEDRGCDLGWDIVGKKPRVAPGCDFSCRKTGASFHYVPPSVCGDREIGAGETFDPGVNGAKVDATQVAQAIGAGNTLDASGRMVTQITAAVGDRQGKTEFDLQCGYTSDANCPANTFLGSNSCCYPRAVATIVAPKNGEANVCRNPLVEVDFDREMDVASFTGKFKIAGPVPASGVCPTGTVSVGPLQKLWEKVSSFFGKIFSFVTGRSASAAPLSCPVPGAVVVQNVTFNGAKSAHVFYTLSVALDPNATYTATIDAAVKTADGVPMGAPTTWSFTTGTDICSVDAVNINPSNALFTSVYANVDDPNSNLAFQAQAVHFDANGAPHALNSIPKTYAWTMGWSVANPDAVPGLVDAISGSLPTDSALANVGVKKVGNGQVTLGATASITDDLLNNPSTKNTAITGTADITVLLCQHPWPARDAVTNSWSPAYDPAFKYSFYYCRDGADGNSSLPELNQNFAIPANTQALRNAGLILNQYLYTYTREAISGQSSLASEGVGLRISANPLHLSPTEWYTAQGFKGKATPTKVDGYEAVQDGRTIYVSGPSLNTGVVRKGTDDYTNIFSWSYTEGAGADTQAIFKQIMNNLRFAADRDASNKTLYNDINVCNTNGAKVCSSDLDCQNAVTPAAICLADRSKIRRDVKRLADLRLIGEAAQRIKDFTGTYPLLASGSFLAGRSVSVWPSWSGALSQSLSGTPPVDPVNKLGLCPGDGVEAATCWSAANQTFVCPANSHVYEYFQASTPGFSLNYNKESTFDFLGQYCRGLNRPQCTADQLCYLDALANCQSRINAVDSCNNNQLGVRAGVCGNGVLEGGEQCEKTVNPTETVACQSASAGFQTDTCGADCQWIIGACVIGKCGNGIKDPGETCDNGTLNGTYGHCNSSCTGIGQNCGDGIIEQGEICDNGASGKTVGGIFYPANGAWSSVAGRGCSADCHAYGDYCGDGKINLPNEFCDGGSESSVDEHGAVTACSNTADGRAQTHTRACASTCGWNDWGDCQPVGSCGNSVKDNNEQCDQGTANSDNSSCLTDCRLASCGDGHVYVGHEQCDNGVAGNIDPNTAAGQATIAAKRGNCSLQSCYYCTNSCTVEAVTGAYCGDQHVDSNLGETCDNGANNVDGSSQSLVDGLQARCNAGDTAACSFCDAKKCQTIQTPHCGDSRIDRGEGCDLGNDNGGTGSTCSSSCQCLAEVFGSGDGSDRLVDAGGNVIGSAVTQSAAFVSRYYGAWLSLPPAGYIWSFDESNPAAMPANYLSDDNVAYFKRAFTMAHPAARVTLEIGLDNNVDQVWVDGQDITSHFGVEMNAIGVDYILDINQFLKPGLAHEVMFKARNVHGYQPPVQNPSMLTYRITADPVCGAVPVVIAPPPPSAVCGNGSIQSGEQCDNAFANINPSDAAAIASIPAGQSYCTTFCQLVTKPAAAVCGNSSIETGEQCDSGAGNIDPNNAAALAAIPGGQTYCTTSCTSATKPVAVAVCGDNIKNGTEECDNGSANSNSGACTRSCKLAVCGDGNKYTGVEQCDSGTGNIDPNNAAAVAAVPAGSSYCTTSCASVTKPATNACAPGVFAVSSPGTVMVSANANMSGAVNATAKPANYFGITWIPQPGESAIWSTNANLGATPANPEVKYFVQTFTIDCDPAVSNAILYIRADDVAAVYLNDRTTPIRTNAVNNGFGGLAGSLRRGLNDLYIVANNTGGDAAISYDFRWQ